MCMKARLIRRLTIFSLPVTCQCDEKDRMTRCADTEPPCHFIAVDLGKTDVDQSYVGSLRSNSSSGTRTPTVASVLRTSATWSGEPRRAANV